MTAGCFFKNIPDKREKFGKLSAGKLLDDIGAKKVSYGGARVFERHANILINNGSASSAELRHLSLMLKSMVKDKFGIELAEEVTLLGDFKED
jgi:UDP-N-acetylmuramate dehydrogenase